MATAIAAGSLLSGAGAATAGATGGAFLSVSAGTLTAVSAGLGAAGTLVSGIQAKQQADVQADIEQQRAQAEQRQINLEIARERAQSAIEDEQRQRRLRRIIATQRATAASGTGSLASGSPVRIEDDTRNVVRREQSRQDLASSIRINRFEGQKIQSSIGGRSRASSARSRGRQSLIGGISRSATQFGDLAQTFEGPDE